MATFFYRACDDQGNVKEGRLSADSKQEVLNHLEERHLHPIHIESLEPKGKRKKIEHFIIRSMPISKRKIAFFFDQLSLMMSSGVTFVEALQTIRDQTDDRRLKDVLMDICEKVEKGLQFHVALEDHPTVFDEVTIRLVEAGERSGKMEATLFRIAGMIEFDIKIKQRLRDATRYPKIVIGILFVAVALLVSLVIPKFSEMFIKAEVALPIVTQLLIFGYQSLLNYWPLILFMMLLLYLIYYVLQQDTRFVYMVERLKIRMPYTSSIVLKIELSRVFRMLSILLDSGIDILNAIELITKITQNKVLALGFRDMKNKLEQGISLPESLNAIPYLPKIARRMIILGDKSGYLSKNLVKLSEIYEKQTQLSIKSVSSMLEPILIVFIGILVLVFALGIFLPMWDLIKVVK